MRKSRRRAKRGLSRRRLVVGAAGMTAAAAVLAVGVHLMQIKQKGGFEGAQAIGSARETLELLERTKETVKEAGTEAARIRVEGTVITGLSAQDARETLLKQYSGPLKVTDGQEVRELRNPLEQEIERLLTLIYDTPEKDMDLKFDQERLQEALEEQVAQLAESWDRKPVDSVVLSYDKATGVYEYSKEQEGRTLDRAQLAGKLLSKVLAGDYTEPAGASFTVAPAERTQAQAKAQYQVIGTFTTKLTDNKNRNKNVSLAAQAIDGLVLQPGEEFSFNETTGNRTREKGYQPAGAYRNGVLIEEPGGGVCQVSTTLYHSIIQSGFKTTERNAHSFAPSYVEKGQDAMVSFDGYAGPDLKFVNTGKAPVVLRASMEGLKLKMSIVGLPVLEEGVEVSIRSEKVRDVDQPEPAYEENPQLPPGTEKVVQEGQSGSVWKSYRVVTKNGEIIEETPLHNSSYKPKAPQVQRNTQGFQVPETTELQQETPAPESQEAAAGEPSAPEAQSPIPPSPGSEVNAGGEAKETTAPENGGMEGQETDRPVNGEGENQGEKPSGNGEGEAQGGSSPVEAGAGTEPAGPGGPSE